MAVRSKAQLTARYTVEAEPDFGLRKELIASTPVSLPRRESAPKQRNGAELQSIAPRRWR